MTGTQSATVGLKDRPNTRDNGTAITSPMRCRHFSQPLSESTGALPVASPSVNPNAAETTLIQRVLAGEAECFYELIRPYERGIYYAALSVLNNDADAEETCQEAILKAFKNLSYFRMEAKFSTWLTQIVINEARLRLRKDRRHLYESVDEGFPDDEGDYIPRDFADWRDIPSEALEKNQLREALKKA
jgi:RNA polymerase sigma-70 factor (ECF subfamily)